MSKPQSSKQWENSNIPEFPHMEVSGINAMNLHLGKASTLLEYGAGGSTILAANTSIETIVSVESDSEFLSALEAKVRNQFPQLRFFPIHVDIGSTREWGYPLDDTHARSWPKYCSEPWDLCNRNRISPDLILIDGRFRVACFFITLLCARRGSVILFDDYFDRDHYHAVEKIITPQDAHGRMAEFIVEKDIDISRTVLELVRYVTVAA